jgi:hypothetical protein
LYIPLVPEANFKGVTRQHLASGDFAPTAVKEKELESALCHRTFHSITD